MEATAVAAGDRGALRVPRSRRGTTTSSRSGRAATLLSPVRMEFDYEVVRPADDARSATGHTVHAALDRDGRPCRLPERVREAVRMKALVTGAAGFIGSHLAERAARRRRRRRRRRLLHRLLPARRSRKRNLAALRGAPALPLRRGAHSGRRPAGAARRRDARVPPGGAGRRAEELGTRFRTSIPTNNIEATQLLLEACVGRPLERFVYASSSSVYGDDVADADARGRAAAAGVAVRRDEAGGRAALLPLLRQLRRAGRVAALLHGLRPAAAARHGVPSVPSRRAARTSRSRCTATASRPATSPSSPTPSRPRSRPATAGVPGRVYNIGGGSRVSINDVLEHDRPRRRPSAAASTASRRRRATCATPTPTRRCARADLGFAPTVGTRRGARGRVQWLSECRARERMSDRSRRAALRSSCVARAALVAACALRPAARDAVPPGTPEPDKFLFDRGTEALNDEAVADRARVLQAARRHLPAEPVSPRRQARRSATPTSAKAARSRSCWRSTSSASSCRSTRPTRAPTTRSTSWRMAHFSQMRAPERDQTETRDAIKEFETFVERYPEQHADRRRRERKLREAQRPARARPTTTSATSTTASAGIRARSTASRRCSKTTRSTPAATRSTSIWPNRSIKIEQDSRSAPLLRKARQGIRAERVSRDKRRSAIAELKAQTADRVQGG